MKRLYILGVCGSIGTQTLDVVRNNFNAYKVIGMSVGSNLQLAVELIEEFKPEIVCFRTETKVKLSYEPIVVYGDLGLLAVAGYHKYEDEWLVNALVGVSGLAPTIKAIECGKHVALANKETLVVGGDLINSLLVKHQVSLVPIDSEHSALWQCLNGEDIDDVKRLIITASGGAFRHLSREELANVTASDALKHPNWQMGAKITVDSATMMNKGFEVIEAHYLFGVPLERIEAILHYGSLVHSLVEFKDGSIKAVLGISDMRIPIAYALSYPKHLPNNLKPLNLIDLKLEFKELSFSRFPCLNYAYLALRKKGLYLAVLNAANEAAVSLFLQGKISFLAIEKIIYDELMNSKYERNYIPSLEERLTISQEIIGNILKKYA